MFPLRNGKLSTECSPPPFGNPLPYLSYILGLLVCLHDFMGLKLFPHRCSMSFPPPHRLKAIDAIMRQSILLPNLACLILIAVYRVHGFSSGAPEESCDSLLVNHTHVGSPAPGAECDATCRQARQLRWIGNSSADSFIYNCNETYQCEFCIFATEVTK